MKAYVVLGANFGDEGKGLMTDYLASKLANTVVVRFNGGAQAGHTVQTPVKQRFIFKHIGSGSLVDSSTYLSEFFICNPLLFREEFQQLENLQVTPKIFVNPKAAVTTPYDMMINQIAEEFRNHYRHGSCGVGINETVERNLHSEFCIEVQDLFDRKKLKAKLQTIQEKWVGQRLDQLGVNGISAVWQQRLSSSEIMDYYLDETDFFIAKCLVTNDCILKEFSSIIFEGAQGLLLDEAKGFFPHVTRSATGLTNVLTIAEAARISQLEVFYMSRGYLTRHGNGPLPFESEVPPYRNICDTTNVLNLYQGSLRFAPLNIDLLQRAIFSDLTTIKNSIAIQPNLVLTCMDQLDEEIQLIIKNQKLSLNKHQFIEEIQKTFSQFKLWWSHGPTRETIEPVTMSIAVSSSN